MLKQARFAMEFCAIESCGKCTPCRIGSTRGVEVVDKIADGIEPEKNRELLGDLCNTMKFGSLCALGGFTPYPVDERHDAFPGGFRAETDGGGGGMMMAAFSNLPSPSRAGMSKLSQERCMSLIHEIDYGTPASLSEKMVTLTIDGNEITVPEGTSVMRASMEAGIEIPKLCATDMIDAFGSCRLCLVEIEGRAGTPASCTTPVAAGMVVHTQTRPAQGHSPRGDGALYLRPSARLSDLRCQRRLRAAGHGGRCRSCATCATAMTARTTSRPATTASINVQVGAEGRIEPLFHLRSGQMHRLLALRTRLRGSAGHLCADHRGARLRFARLGGHA